MRACVFCLRVALPSDDVGCVLRESAQCLLGACRGAVRFFTTFVGTCLNGRDALMYVDRFCYRVVSPWYVPVIVPCVVDVANLRNSFGGGA